MANRVAGVRGPCQAFPGTGPQAGHQGLRSR